MKKIEDLLLCDKVQNNPVQKGKNPEKSFTDIDFEKILEEISMEYDTTGSSTKGEKTSKPEGFMFFDNKPVYTRMHEETERQSVKNSGLTEESTVHIYQGVLPFVPVITDDLLIENDVKVSSVSSPKLISEKIIREEFFDAPEKTDFTSLKLPEPNYERPEKLHFAESYGLLKEKNKDTFILTSKTPVQVAALAERKTDVNIKDQNIGKTEHFDMNNLETPDITDKTMFIDQKEALGSSESIPKSRLPDAKYIVTRIKTSETNMSDVGNKPPALMEDKSVFEVNNQKTPLNKISIIEQVSMASERLSFTTGLKDTVVVRLKPENLGSIVIRVEKTEKGCIAAIYTQKQEVGKLLKESVSEITAILTDKAGRLERFTVEPLQEHGHGYGRFDTDSGGNGGFRGDNGDRKQNVLYVPEQAKEIEKTGPAKIRNVSNGSTLSVYI